LEPGAESSYLIYWLAWELGSKELEDQGYINIYVPRESKDQTLPIGIRESFIWTILKTILCLVLDFQSMCFSFRNGIVDEHILPTVTILHRQNVF